MSDKCKLVSAKACLDILKNDQAILIDIRQFDEFNKEHIAQGKNIHPEKLNSEEFSKDDILIVHCQAGVRTKQIQGELAKLPVKEIYIMAGGINAWKKEGFETIVNKKAPLPIMRQVQIIVGLMVLIGVVLGFLISPYFTLVSAFFGLGLLFAGLSGFCGLAKILMLFPYNRQ